MNSRLGFADGSGSAVLTADAEALARRAITRSAGEGLGAALGASIATAPLGDLIGSLGVSGRELRGQLSLEIE